MPRMQRTDDNAKPPSAPMMNMPVDPNEPDDIPDPVDATRGPGRRGHGAARCQAYPIAPRILRPTAAETVRRPSPGPTLPLRSLRP